MDRRILMKTHNLISFILLSHIIWLIITFFSLTTPAFSQDPFGTTRIQVKDFYTETILPGAKINLSPNNYSGITNEQGIVLIEGIMPYRNYQIRVSLEGYIDQEIGFVSLNANEQTEVFVPMKKKASITGTVKINGKFLQLLDRPLEEAMVILGDYNLDLNIFQVMQSAQTNKNGDFQFDCLEEGKYKIIALKTGYKKSKMHDITLQAGKIASQDFMLKPKRSIRHESPEIIITDGLTNIPREEPYSSASKFYFTCYPQNAFSEFFWIKEKQPKEAVRDGNDLYYGEPKGSVFCYVLSAIGEYTITLFTIDENGRTEKASITFKASNMPPEAIASVIPGPCELPFVDSNLVYTTSTGSSSVRTGKNVYLRGFGIDRNLLCPDEFNPHAPSFDFYGNKNGDCKASLFDYNWTLKDKNDFDVSAILKPAANFENVSFTIPLTAQPGDIYKATLNIIDDHGISSEPESIIITVAENCEEACCALCHQDISSTYIKTPHANASIEVKCQNCHGPGSEHISGFGNPDLSVSQRPGVCGQCHKQFAELQKTNHSDPLSFGYYEPTDGRLISCYKCHYEQGYIEALESEKPFHEFRYGPDIFSKIPKDGTNISCTVCHDPHGFEADNAYGLRAGTKENACDTCHYEKWQNAVLEGMAGNIKNGYHYADQDYSQYAGENNPHRTDGKCVDCHMCKAVTNQDALLVRKVGGHTGRMRDFGLDMVPGTADDILNIKICQKCHQGLETFDRNGIQTEIRLLLSELAELLKQKNYGFLPANQPGRCARCHHSGGTVPFLNDPNRELENAYTNYKLMVNDRSFGIHNPGYVKKLLKDSINAVKSLE